MIGNDIVDLQLAKKQSNWQRPGFLDKQYSKKEQQEILNSESPFLKVWVFWSMKEAAYKCYLKEHKKRFFAPKKFQCTSISSDQGFVNIADKKYFIKIDITKQYIHSVATERKHLSFKSKSFFLEGKNESKEVKFNLLDQFSDTVKVYKDAIGIPFLKENNRKLPFSISTSHHGKFGSFAISSLL